jgi:hypothetical protein
MYVIKAHPRFAKLAEALSKEARLLDDKSFLREITDIGDIDVRSTAEIKKTILLEALVQAILSNSDQTDRLLKELDGV